MNSFFKKYIWTVLAATVLTSFTVYVALDTFIITRVYSTVITQDSLPQNNSASEPEANEAEASLPATEATMTENTYSDANITITIAEYREYNTTLYVADVQVSSPEYLKTAFAQNTYGKNVTAKTSAIAEANGAILAINGDFYGAQTKGYVLRNGTLYRESADSGQEDLVIWSDGSLAIITEDKVSAAELEEKGAVQVLSFGPALVDNGSIAVSEKDEVGKAMASNPRTAIGIIDDLHYVFVVSDGRTGVSSGLSLYQLAEFMESLSVDTAYNLDGGGSSTMVFNGEIINNPTTNGKKISERSVSDIVYIGY
ncbi:exopolysaccharide biosynthesis protein [Desulfitobacterium sp. LBE]|uniref:phosphodiester glycosidase family protein n=1 Tax=Desulfitobacterium sp. LBE TaxID=884086 RepID=UPI00119A5FAA|nr:phosphodiester glycosidase family protein [Desulfitobacterium sp. LBE]TWH56042.1 exopolysaccharide biosynthesis protein [Desulfitobacterium sp. LBE]